MTKISAPPRLRVIPILRHSREGGNPSPALSSLSNILVRAKTRRREGVALRLCASARTKIKRLKYSDFNLHYFVIASEALQSRVSLCNPGLFRRFASRNDGSYFMHFAPVRVKPQRREKTPSRLCGFARTKTFLNTDPWVMDSRLRGNDGVFDYRPSPL